MSYRCPARPDSWRSVMHKTKVTEIVRWGVMVFTKALVVDPPE
jgi:hypothetical protein